LDAGVGVGAATEVPVGAGPDVGEPEVAAAAG
jgi:hypothetical protein